MPNTRHICPYCARELPKPLTRSKKCPFCHEHIYVRTIDGGEKLLMTEIESWDLFRYPPIKRENVRGNPRRDLCRCHECGDIGSYLWRYGIDHFPLQCHSCEAKAVLLIDADNVTEEDIDGLYRAAEQHENEQL